MHPASDGLLSACEVSTAEVQIPVRRPDSSMSAIQLRIEDWVGDMNNRRGTGDAVPAGGTLISGEDALSLYLGEAQGRTPTPTRETDRA